MEIEGSKSGGSGSVTISTTSFSVNANEEPLELEELELPDTVFRSRHAQLLNSLVTDDNDDYGDIQFFHHHSHIQQQLQFQQQQHDHFLGHDGDADFEGAHNNTGSNINGNHSNSSSENPFVLMDQFFPGRSIEGYLETILEETDEEFEEEECSGRHWWVADSDSDTNSVIRVDSDFQSKKESSSSVKDTGELSKEDKEDVSGGGGRNKEFRVTASSKPFEDGHLFDQIDFDFEETLMGLEPRRRSGIVQSGEQSSRLLAEQPFEQVLKCETSIQRNNLKHGGGNFEGGQDNMSYLIKYGNGKCSDSPDLDEDEIQPAEVNEEDFFYTSEDSDGSSEENSEATSSDDGEKNDGVVLAEFSLNSSMCNRFRRSFEGQILAPKILGPNSKLKSFRSFDSLNLAGTELLFSSADTFPSFHYIKEVSEPSPSSVEVEGGRDKYRKNSDSSAERPTEMSTENLSEDSGIGGDGTGVGSALNLNLNSPQQCSNLNNLPSISSANEQSLSFIAKSEFALNPFVFSSASASEENSMNSSLFHAVGGMDREQIDSINPTSSGRGDDKKEGNPFFPSPSSSSSLMSSNNQTVIPKSTLEVKKNDNPEVRGEECKGTHPTSTFNNDNVPSTTTTTTPPPSQVEFAQEQLVSSVEPDVVAQCNMTSVVGRVVGTEVVGEPQAVSPIVVEKLEGLPPLVNNIETGGRANELPTPHSEVLLKFMDEDMRMENDFSKSQGGRKSESEFGGEEDGANNVYGLAHVIIESNEEEECMMRTGRGEGGIESGPMSTLSSGVDATPTTGLTLMTMGLPSLAQNNNNSTTLPSSHCKESLLLENELPPTCRSVGIAQHTTAHEQEQQEQQQPSLAGGDSVCVQTSGWTNVVHSPVQESLTKESVEFISGSSKFGCTRTSLQDNLDRSESLAQSEHLCNSTRNTVEEILCPADNGISTSESNLTTPPPPTTVVIEKPGSSHPIISPPRALPLKQSSHESLSSSSFVPDILSLSDPITKESLLSSSSSSSSSTANKSTKIMEVMERRSMSPSSSSSIPSAIKTKTYGPRNEVEVFLVSSRTPSPSMKVPTEDSNFPESVNSGKVVKKEVHFCPVVSEISWRESYTDQGSEFSESSDNLLDDQDSISVDDIVDGKMDFSGKRSITESVTVSEQVTQPIENIVLLSHDNSSAMTSPSQNNSENEIKVRSRHHNSTENTNGHFYEDVGGNVDLNNITVSQAQHQPSTLSMVPDLLSQCENASQSHTHITVKIEEKIPLPSSPHHHQQQSQQQQQIFPSIFADKSDKNEGKNGNKSKKTSGKSFNIPLGTSASGKKNEKEKDKPLKIEKDINKDEPISKDNSVGNSKNKASKPGFFERLSKIRLSGSKNKNKKKIHPKENENVDQSLHNHTNDDNSGSTTIASKTTPSQQQQVVKGKSPILKKYPANSPTPITSTTPTNTSYDGTDGEVEKSSEAFEHILDDIAGINVIKLRQQQHGRLVLGPNAPSPTQKIGPDGNKVRSFAERKQFFVNLPKSGQGKGESPLDVKLNQFKEETTRTWDQISKSHPDLEVIEGVTRDSLSVTIEPSKWDSRQPDSHQKEIRNRPNSPSQRMTTTDTSPEMGSQQRTEREWYRLKKSVEKYQKNYKDKEKNFRTGVTETDLDEASREMLDLDSEVVELEKVPTASTTTTAKTRSLTDLSSAPLSLLPQELNENLPPQGELSDSDERAKSLEFLLDENHKSSSVPPENTLRLESRQLSEHELRIQRSLQKLNVPEWYKKSLTDANTNKSTSSKLLKRSEFGSASGLGTRQGGWSAYRSSRESLMSPSSFETLSSLPNNGRYSGSLNRSNFVRGRPATRSSRESLLSPSSTASQSPSAFERCSFTYGMPLHLTRFNSRLSTGSGASPMSSSPPSTPVNPVGPTYVKKPYLGWRSQEKINMTPSVGPPSSSGLRLSIYRPPAERLAAEILSSKTKSPSKPMGADRPPLPPPRAEKTMLTNKNPELVPCNSPTSSVHDSIREVTQQINEFVHHGEPPKPKPRQKQTGKRPALWIESSFVG